MSDKNTIMEISQHDVFRFIANMAGHTPNYAMLLGAGCSVTSGIDSAVKLINRWKREIYLEAHPEADINNIDNDTIEEYLESKNLLPGKENSYSYYFNKRFPIEKQKYIFIENEIDDELVRPFIGYACAVGLAEAGYIDTFFTTNFDDLLNEAFYMYGTNNKRPLVCYLDSNANYVSLNSNRVRIIKLHGDYMYGEMKITEPQTERLSENLSNVFGEFAKARGLIVLGYAGNDASIMNTLHELLKDANNYKNGIIWCLRKGEAIPDRLKEIVKNTKCNNVFVVHIDGFDEFLMELYSFLLDDKDPVAIASNDIKEKLLENDYWSKTDLLDVLKCEHDKISKDLRKKKRLDGDDSFDENKNKYIADKNERLKKYHSIVKSIDAHEYDNALDDIENRLNEDMKLSDRLDLLRFKANCLYCKHDYDGAYSVLMKIINGNKYYASDYVNASLCVDDLKLKIDILDQGIDILPGESKLYARKGEALIDIEENDIQVHDTITDRPNDEIIEVLKSGLTKDISIHNDCWRILYNYLLDYAKRNDDYEYVIKLTDYFYDKVPYSSYVIKAKSKIMEFKDKASFKDICSFVDENKLKDPEIEYVYEKIKVDSAIRMHAYEYLKDFCLADFEGSKDSILLSKCRILADVFREPEKAIECMEAFLNKHYSESVADTLAHLYLDYGKIEECENLISEYNFDETEYEQDLLSGKEDLVKLIELYEKELKENPDDRESIIGYSHTLLLLGEGEDAYEYLSGVFKRLSDHTGIIAINYYLAKQLSGKKINNEKNINAMASVPLVNSTLENAAAWYMKKDQACEEGNRILIQVIENNYREVQHIKECYVFRKYLNEDILQDSILSRLCTIPVSEYDIQEIEESIMKLI